VHEFDKVEVPRDEHGRFFSGDSYVLLYKYRVELKGKDQHLAYFWQGADSTRVRDTASIARHGDVRVLTGAAE
jgi:hypothetical protein